MTCSPPPTIAEWLHAAGIGPTALAEDHHAIEAIAAVAAPRGVRLASLTEIDLDAVREALRERWGLPLIEPMALCDARRLSDPFDPRHQEAVAESTRHFLARVGRLPRAAE